jgi:sRNA-binding carbon storage regulator CsrA
VCRAGGLRTFSSSFMEVMMADRQPLTGLTVTRAMGERLVIEVDGKTVWLEFGAGRRSSEVSVKIQADKSVGIWREEVWLRRNGSAG